MTPITNNNEQDREDKCIVEYQQECEKDRASLDIRITNYDDEPEDWKPVRSPDYEDDGVGVHEESRDEGTEDRVLNKIIIEQALSRLVPLDRDVVYLCTGYRRPPRYTGILPATMAQASKYLEKEYMYPSLGAMWVSRRFALIKASWRWGQARMARLNGELADASQGSPTPIISLNDLIQTRRAA